MASSTQIQRKIRWLRINHKLPLIWNQIKQAPHPTKDQLVTIASDRSIIYTKSIPNPDYVAPEARKGRSTPLQRTLSFQQYAYTKEVRDSLQEQADEVLALIQKIASGAVLEASYSFETGLTTYMQQFTVAGSSVNEGDSTSDETIAQAFEQLGAALAAAVSSEDKTVELAEYTDNSDIIGDIREP